MSTSTDRIEKTILLRAPNDRVWRAISNAEEFGTWFGVEFDAPFEAGTRINGRIVPTKVDPEIAKAQEPHAGTLFECSIERVEPIRLFSFRWNPCVAEPGVENSNEPSTLVVFELEEVSGGTRLTITESGFDKIPVERRASAFARNEQGWEGQTKLIEKYLASAA